ncbi:peptidoglycan-binding domain-containing protein [Belnapia sp. F-4-1]|uniref:peptidoglycan-binding domain-containing protein n=1 Tax=Belnapia sp. F-4-1 TaxID=1545443 RepID=UPI00118545A5|nr:peptidoglycan-binding domain-containing protein [Belnapia sp. F-4-1]
MEQLGAFAQGSETLEAARLVRRPGLVAELQTRLAHHGLLDPPANGLFDPVTQWALGAFCSAVCLPFNNELTPPVAAALRQQAPALPLKPGNSLAGRIAAALIRCNHWICRHPECVNIVYVEGMDEQGCEVPRRHDAFDDLRLLLRIGSGGCPKIVGAWCATTASGRLAVETPAEPEGAPRLAAGQHRVWVVGRTAIGTALEQEALVQVLPVLVTRNADRDFQRNGDPMERGIFLIDQHGGHDAPRERVGGIGAGCLVGRSQAGHGSFMARLRDDPRWRVNAAHVFTTSILQAKDVTG